MKESLGSTFTLNVIIIFITILFAVLAATLTYYKAFKVNTKIINSIEKFEGYNGPAREEIDNSLTTIGYAFKDNHKCPSKKNGGTLVELKDEKFRYCVYYFGEEDSSYYSYGVITYVTLDIPMIDTFLRIPVYTKSDRIYDFNG